MPPKRAEVSIFEAMGIAGTQDITMPGLSFGANRFARIGLVLFFCVSLVDIFASWWWLAAVVVLVGAGLPKRFQIRPWCLGMAVVMLFVGPRLAMQEERRKAWAALWYAQDEPVLVSVEGMVIEDPVYRLSAQGAMAAYDYQRPSTRWLIKVNQAQTVDADGRVQQHGLAKGSVKLQVVSNGVVRGLHAGDAIEATGWLRPIQQPMNPGAFDARDWWQRQGVVGRLVVGDEATTIQVVSQPNPFAAFVSRWRASAGETLVDGVSDGRVAGLLRRIILGQRPADHRDDPADAFVGVGLAHVMSLSGAHMAVVLLMVGLSARLLSTDPRIQGVLLTAAMLGFLFFVPWRVPILRAAMMSLAVVGAFGLGRRASMADRVGLAAIIVLLLAPGQWREPGFQLSFGVVGALACWASGLTGWLEGGYRRLRRRNDDQMLSLITRRVCAAVSVSVVAFAVSWPLVCFHFEQAHPWTVTASLMTLLPMTLLIAVGLFKLLLGAWIPMLGVWLAPVTTWTGHVCLDLVDGLARLPGSSWTLAEPPSVLWLVIALLSVVGVFMARGIGRWGRRACLITHIGCVAWLGFAGGLLGSSAYPRPAEGGLSITMLSVGDGSAWVIRTHRHNLLYDCGSQTDTDVGIRVADALRALHVDRVDGVFVSHADLDHYVGLLDLSDALPVKQLWTPQQTFARITPGSALQAVRNGLTHRGVPETTVQRGWAWSRDGVQIEALWPSPTWLAEEDNNNALVLRIAVGGRRILLFGDNQGLSLSAMQADGLDLRADIAEAPHHGAANGLTQLWLEAVSPAIVLQSSGRARIAPDRDPWWTLEHRAPLDSTASTPLRYVTAKNGAVTINVDAAGDLRVKTVLPVE